MYTQSSNPISQLRRRLLEEDQSELAEKIQVIRKANNVLKHGEGDSLDWLVAQKSRLWFPVKEKQSDFLDEGDAAEIETFVDTRGNFFPVMKIVIEACLQVLPELDDWS